MNFPFYIAQRYINSKKSSHIINIISWISMIGIAVGTMALIVVLSVFNGIEDLSLSMVNTFDPPLKVVPIEGKHFKNNTINYEKLYNISDIQHIVEVIEENALAEYDGQQYVVRVKGVSSNYQDFIPIDSMIYGGKFILENGEYNYASVGAGVSYHLNINVYNKMKLLMLIAPKRTFSQILQSNSFTTKQIMPESVFSVEPNYDKQYVIVPLRFAKELFQYDSMSSFLEIWCNEKCNINKLQKSVQDVVGEDFTVLNRQEQQETLYKIMRSEKWAVFIILTFILIVASFNMISSMSIIIIDKQKDMFTLNAMGSSLKKIRKIFLLQGILQTCAGAIAGLLFGLFVCWIQIQFGIVSLGNGSGSFAVDAYPVSIRFLDIILVFITTQIIGFLASIIPAFRINKNFLSQK